MKSRTEAEHRRLAGDLRTAAMAPNRHLPRILGETRPAEREVGVMRRSQFTYVVAVGR